MESTFTKALDNGTGGQLPKISSGAPSGESSVSEVWQRSVSLEFVQCVEYS